MKVIIFVVTAAIILQFIERRIKKMVYICIMQDGIIVHWIIVKK